MNRKQIGRIGRMVGVGQCKCTTYKAVSGKPESISTPSTGPAGQVCDNVVVPAGDKLMEAVTKANVWVCAAAKIITNAGGHRLEALSERWVGAKQSGGARRPKLTSGATDYIFPLATNGGLVTSRADSVANQPEKYKDEIPSGESVPSCGKCQVFLPALICETKPCSAGG